MGRGETTPPLTLAETVGETGVVGTAAAAAAATDPGEADVEELAEVLFMAEVKSPNGLGNPGHKAGGTRPYKACCC